MILRAAFLAATAALAALASAACHDTSVSSCFDPGVAGYEFNPPGDTNGVFHWPASYLPVRVYAEPVAQLQQNADSAMRLWVNAFRCRELSMQRVADSTTADIVIRNPVALPAPAAALRFAADSVGACTGRTDVSIDAQNRIERPIRSYVAPQNLDTAAVSACYHFVVAHELGHALGLFQHSSDPGDLMYPVPRRRALSAADRFTIQILYNTPPTMAPTPR